MVKMLVLWSLKSLNILSCEHVQLRYKPHNIIGSRVALMTGIWRRGDNSFSEEKSPRVSVICGLESCAFSAVGQHFVCLANKNGVSGDFGSYRLCPVCPMPARGTEVFSLGGEGGWSVGRDRRLSPATSPLPCRLSCRAQDSEAGWRRANRFMGWLVHFLVNKPGQNQYVTACGYVTWGLALAERGFARGGFGDAMKPTEENQYWINWVAAGRSGGKILKKKVGNPPSFSDSALFLPFLELTHMEVISCIYFPGLCCGVSFLPHQRGNSVSAGSLPVVFPSSRQWFLWTWATQIRVLSF